MPCAREEKTNERARKWLPIASLSPLILIAALFVSQLAAVSTYRLDYPINDDWRYYSLRYRMPDELSLGWLIQPARDTIHATGKLADWLFFRFVAHDYHHLAVASFALCFGGWLVCSLTLTIITARKRPALMFACLLVSFLPLAAMPYWVSASQRQWLEPTIAYHQMLPVLGLFMLALLCLAERSRWPGGLDLAIAAAGSLVFSLAYSSGAIALLVFGALVALLSKLGPRPACPQLRSTASLGIVIVAIAGLCLVAHILAPTLEYHVNPVLEARVSAMAYPWTPRFWIFFFALFDRAVLSTATGGAAAVRGVAVAAVVIAPAIGLLVLLAKRRLDARRGGFAMVLVAAILAVVAYAVLVSYGRGTFGAIYFQDKVPPDLRASLYAHHRFFYWWITAVLPLTAIAWGILLEAIASRRVAAAASITLAVLLLLPKAQVPAASGAYLRHWNFAALYQRDAEELALIQSRDVARSQGQHASSPRRKQWSLLPKDKRSPMYQRGSRNESYAKRKPLYRRARKMGANFMEDSALRLGKRI